MTNELKQKANLFRDKTIKLGYSDNLRKIVCFLIGGEPKIKNEDEIMDKINDLIDKGLTENEFIIKAIEIVTN